MFESVGNFLKVFAPALFQGIINISNKIKIQNMSQLEERIGHKEKLDNLNI